jgi:hypothetical protein
VATLHVKRPLPIWEQVFHPDRLWPARLMKDTSMTEPLVSGFLDHARRALDSLLPFHRSYIEYQRGDSDKLEVMETAWRELLPVCIDAGKSTSGAAGELADWIHDAERWCKRFSESVDKQGFGEAVFQDHCDGIMRIVQSGWQLLAQHIKKDNPFAFLQESKGNGKSSDAEPSVANPLQILSAGNAAIADAQKAVSDTLAAGNQALSNGEHKGNANRRVESKFPKPDDSLTDDAIEYLKKAFHKLPHAGTAQVNRVIAAAVKDGIQRNSVEWALIRMQEYGWIKLSIPVWGGVIGNHRSDATYQAPVQKQKPNRWYFGTQEYDLRLTEYFYNPAYCVTCSKLIGDYDYDRSECHDCRSPQGKLADLEVAIKCQQLYGNDDPERIQEWATIRAYLRDKFGPDRTNMQLWEWMTDHLRVLGWNEDKWLRMKYGDFIELLKSGLLNERQSDSKGGSVSQSSAKLPLYDEDVHVGMVDLSELTKLCTLLLRQDKRQGTLYRDEAGRYIYRIWDYDEKSIGRTCRLMRPADAYEVALKAEQASDELIAELANLKTNRNQPQLIAKLPATAPGESDAKKNIAFTKPITDRRSIEEIERNTPELDTQSIEWVAARKKNLEKLGYPTNTLATYRLESSGGRQLSPYFGIDKDGRRWRRQSDKTEESMVFYFAADLKKYQSKVSN